MHNKGSQSTIGDALVCKIYERTDDRKDINITESMDLGNDVCPDRNGKFCYLGDMSTCIYKNLNM